MILAVAAIAAGALMVSCGGDDDSSPSATASGQSDGAAVTTSDLSKAEFVKRANAACLREREDLFPQMTAYQVRNEKKGTPQAVVIANMFKAVFVPVVEAEIAAIRDLGAPEGDEDVVEALLVAQQDALNDIEKLKRAKSIFVFEEYFEDANRKLNAYGLSACTKGE